MVCAHRSRSPLLLVLAAMTLFGACATAADDIEPTNDLPNPYHTIAPWGNLPEGRKWGALNGVAIDNDGESVWVADRCGANPDIPPGASPFTYDSCAGSSLSPVLKFDSSGKLLQSFGAGMFIFPTRSMWIGTATCGWSTCAAQTSASARRIRKQKERATPW